MKKHLSLLVVFMMMISGITFAQSKTTGAPAPKAATQTTPAAQKKKPEAVKPGVAGPVKKDGTPDKRYKENKKLKKDGTPDKRYKEHKKAAPAN